MDIDALTGEFESFLERARTKLDQEITGAKKIVADLNAEKTAARATLTQLADQKKQAEVELSTVMKDLQRGSAKVAVNYEITEARKELQTLKAEIAKSTAAVAALKLQQTEVERLRVGEWNEVARLRAERAEHSTAIGDIRVQLGLRR